MTRVISQGNRDLDIECSIQSLILETMGESLYTIDI